MARASVGGSGGGPVVYFEIADFREGMDLRKSALTAKAGTLRLLQNAHITPGGEVEKRSAFQYWCTLTSNSVGLCAVNGQVFTHVPGTPGAVTPPTTSYPGIIHYPTGLPTLKQISYDVFEGYAYTAMQDPSNNFYNFYNGAQVTNFPAGLGPPYFVRTYKDKMYGLFGRNLMFSAVGDPTAWQDPPPVGGVVTHNGSGFISIGANDADAQTLTAMEVYYDKMAIFSTLSCQLWFLDPDPSLNQYYQTLRDAGTIAPRSVRQYIANDVYFLGTHGIRSLRARDLSLTAAVADVGSPLDPLLQDLMATAGYVYTSSCISVLSPRSGRIWVIFPDRIYILSNFASPNISAWSVYIPEFTVTDAVYADPFVILRDNANNLYRFGAYGVLTYDSCTVEMDQPFLSFDKPCTYKFYQGFDAICTNTWSVQASFDPTQDPPPFDQICTITGPTMLGGRIPISGRSTHIQVKMSCTAPGPATLSKVFIHYAPSETD